MAPPRKTYLRDLDAEEKVSLHNALEGTEPHREFRNDSKDSRGETVVIAPSSEFSAIDGVPVPKREEVDTPEGAVWWSEQEILKATPRAVQEVIHQLKKGNSKERMVAALQLLERAGVQKKEQNHSVSPIFVLTPEAVKTLPWVKQVKQLTQQGNMVDAAFTEVVADAKKDG
jgi:hypothetical protein